MNASQKSKFSQVFWHFSILMIAAIAVFSKVPSFSFIIGWDDQWFVTNRYTENGLNYSNVSKILTEYYRGQYAPTNQLYYTTLFEVFDYNTKVYHIFSIAIHLINSYLVYFLTRRLSLKCSKLSDLERYQVSFYTSLLFLVAPINLEPVAWTAASKVLLYGTFYMASLLFYCAYLEKHKSKYFYCTLFFFIVSFGAKEQAVVLPMALLLLDFLYHRDMRTKEIWLEKAPFIVLALLFGILTIDSQGVSASGSFYNLYQRLLLASYSIVEYIVKAVIPVNLSYIYPFPFKGSDAPPIWLVLHPILLMLGIFFLREYLRIRWVLIGGLFFLIHIILVSNLLSLARHSIIADRYAYLAVIGIFFIISISVVFAQRKYPGSKMLFLSYFIALSISTYTHSDVWSNSKTLKSEVKSQIENRNDYKRWKK